MKTKPFLLILLLILVLFVVQPAFALQGEGPNLPGLQPWMLGVLGVVTSILIAVVRFVLEAAQKVKIKIPKEVWYVLVYLISSLLASWMFPVEYPSIHFTGADLAENVTIFGKWVADFFVAISPSFVVATAFYKYLLEKLTNVIGFRSGIRGYPAIAPK